MTNQTRSRIRFSFAISLATLFQCCVITCEAYSFTGDPVRAQWGGPDRNFRYPASILSKSWGSEGPQIKWKRELGGGYAGIVVAQGRAFTTIRQAGQEIDIALDAESGDTIWSFKLDVPEMDLDYGMGPFATPLATDDQVVFLGGSGILRSFEPKSGKLQWRLNLAKRYETWEPDGGYASSPILIDGLIVLQVGSKDASIIAVDSKTGKPVWAEHNFKTDYASPVVLRTAGRDQVICHMEDDFVSINPVDGGLLWREPSKSTKTQHVIAPVNIGKDRILASTTYSVKAYQLKNGKPKSIWESNLIRSQVGNLVYLPDQEMIIGASGALTGSPIVAIDASSGELLWKSRSMECGFLWQIGDRLFCLSRSGELVQGIANRQSLQVLDSHRVFNDTKVWNAPGVSGSLLILKDQEQIVAFEMNP